MTRHTQVRLRLAASYIAFSTVLLAAIGFFFWRHLKEEADLSAQMLVDADWGATAGYLRIENQRPEWVYDRGNPDEAYTVERLRHVYLLADDQGEAIECSTIYNAIGVDTPQTQAAIRRVLNAPTQEAEYTLQKDKYDTPYMIRAGWTRDDNDRKYFLAIGRSLAIPYRAAERVLQTYSLIAVAMLFLAGLFGWWQGGIAIQQSERVL